MPDLLSLLAEAQGNKLAVIDDRPDGTLIEWSFADLEANANRLAQIMITLGARPKSKIVWCGQNSPWIVAMMHAARKIGCVAVPLNYRLAPEEAAYVVDNSDSEIVFADAEFAGMFSRIRSQLPTVREYVIFDGEPDPGMLNANELLKKASPQSFESEQEEAAGTMIYTSGTTGKPKGAVRYGDADPDAAAELLTLIGYVPDDIYLTTGPLYHSGPGGFMGIAHMLGNTVVVQRKFDALDWLRLLDKYKVSSTFSSPTTIRMVCNLDKEIFDKYDTSSMRVMIANAAPWSFALKQSYLARFPAESLFEVYGSTELGVNTVLLPEDQLRKRGSCGKPAPGVEISLFDEDGNEVTEPHTPGEIYVRSKNMYSTYYKAEDKYEADRRDDKHTVGDIAYFDEEGYYFICDRKTDMIISGGMNIYPAEIEDALEHHDSILDVAVFGIPSEEWGELVHAVIVANPEESLSEEEIIAYAREHLASYKIPRSIAFTDEIPRTGSGKILKKDMRAPYWEGHSSAIR
jgi:fatty-acyl-CoA synthase/long-chain acyl-CoA synthetase